MTPEMITQGTNRNILVFDADANDGEFTPRLVELMKITAEENPDLDHPHKNIITDLYIPPTPCLINNGSKICGVNILYLPDKYQKQYFDMGAILPDNKSKIVVGVDSNTGYVILGCI